MIVFLLFSCSGIEYVLPEAEVFFHDEEGWEGSLSFLSFDGEREQCVMYYTMQGEEEDCTDCIWQVEFTLSSLSEPCVYSDLESLSFRLGTDNQWFVKEETGWEEWGSATEEDGYWSFVSAHRFLP